MERITDSQLQRLLNSYTTTPPSPELERHTRGLIHGELAARRQEMHAHAASGAATRPAALVVTVLALTVLVCFNLCYAATVVTVLKMFLPGTMDVYLNHSLLGISVAGAAFVFGLVLTAFFKLFQMHRPPAEIRIIEPV